MVLQTHLQYQIIYISPAPKYKHHSTAILIHTVTSGCTTTAWFLNLKTLFLMCKMIIHYRTYLQNGITNTVAMPNNFLSHQKKLAFLSVISLCLPYKEDPHWFSVIGSSTGDGDHCLQEYAVRKRSVYPGSGVLHVSWPHVVVA